MRLGQADPPIACSCAPSIRRPAHLLIAGRRGPRPAAQRWPGGMRLGIPPDMAGGMRPGQAHAHTNLSPSISAQSLHLCTPESPAAARQMPVLDLARARSMVLMMAGRCPSPGPNLGLARGRLCPS